jgi:hypothetical protein
VLIVSAHISTVPTATPGFRTEIYGREGALQISTPGSVVEPDFESAARRHRLIDAVARSSGEKRA